MTYNLFQIRFTLGTDKTRLSHVVSGCDTRDEAVEKVRRAYPNRDVTVAGWDTLTRRANTR